MLYFKFIWVFDLNISLMGYFGIPYIYGQVAYPQLKEKLKSADNVSRNLIKSASPLSEEVLIELPSSKPVIGQLDLHLDFIYACGALNHLLKFRT